MAAPVVFAAAASRPTKGDGGRPKLEHAFLELRDPPVNQSSLQPGRPRGRIDFQFNPKELSVGKSAKWNRDAQRGSRRSGVPEFMGSQPSSLSLEMFLDASDRQDDRVVQTVERLFACCVPTEESNKKHQSSPPWVVFHWGGLTGFTAYVSSVQVKYTLFTPGGMPIRAVATVKLEEIAGEQPGQNPTSGGLAARRTRILEAGDTLPLLAWREYGDAGMWRRLAAHNRIDDPARLLPGTPLFIPAADELDG